jgi:hypothetical protein
VYDALLLSMGNALLAALTDSRLFLIHFSPSPTVVTADATHSDIPKVPLFMR